MRDTLTFSAGEVRRAAGITADVLQNYVKQNPLPADFFDGGGARGQHKRYSLPALMYFCVAGALIRHGTPTARAFAAAASYAFVGKADDTETGAVVSRRPGLPFHWKQGKTFLILTLQGHTITLVRDGMNLPLYDARARNEQGFPLVFSALNLSALFDRAVAQVGRNGPEILNAAYGWNAEGAT